MASSEVTHHFSSAMATPFLTVMSEESISEPNERKLLHTGREWAVSLWGLQDQ